MPNLNDVLRLQGLFLKIINKYNILGKIPLDHGTGDLLFPAEVHTLEAIGRNPGVTVTALAEQQGVTKGAVSQVVGKLLRKGLLEKRRSAEDGKVLHLTLTARGQIVDQGHARFHARYDQQALAALLALSEIEFETLQRFLALTETTLDAYLADLAPAALRQETR